MLLWYGVVKGDACLFGLALLDLGPIWKRSSSRCHARVTLRHGYVDAPI